MLWLILFVRHLEQNKSAKTQFCPNNFRSHKVAGMVWIHHAGALGVRARSAVMGEEKSFREINSFVLGKGEKRLISVRSSAWENLATNKGSAKVECQHWPGRNTLTLFIPTCPCPLLQPRQAPKQPMLLLRDLPVST